MSSPQLTSIGLCSYKITATVNALMTDCMLCVSVRVLSDHLHRVYWIIMYLTQRTHTHTKREREREILQ